jgi:WD40 repeat protein
MNRLEELLLLWQDQSIAEEELAELKKLLASPEGRVKAAEDFFLTGVVLEAVRAQSAAEVSRQPALQPFAGTALASSSGSPWLRPRVAWITTVAAALLVALGDTGGEVEVWDVKTGELAWSGREHVSGVASLAFSPDGKLLASGSWDKTVVVWNMAAKQEKTRILMVPALAVRSLAFAPDGQTLAIAVGPGDPRIRQPGDIKLWDVATETVRATLHGHSRTVTSIAYSADGQTLVSGSADSTVRFWDLATGREYGMLKGHKAAVGFEGLAVALSPDGAWLATASFDHTVKLWKVAWMKKDLPANTQIRTRAQANPIAWSAPVRGV